MKKVAVLGVALLGLFMGACCSVETQSVDSLGRTQDLINTEFLKYVDSDPKLADDAGKKKQKDWHDLVKSEQDLRAGLLKK